MNILHAHFQPPQTSEHTGGVLFWVETSDVPAPKQTRAVKKAKSGLHLFCADTGTLNQILDLEGASRSITLRLPAVKNIPLPSPQLIHNWNLDSKNPKLSAFLVHGIWVRSEKAIPALLAFSTPQPDPTASHSPAPDLRYWSMVSALALETLAAYKLVPVIGNAGKDYFAHWLPVLDSPKDAARLKQLEEALPAVCRAGSDETVEEEVEVIIQLEEQIENFWEVCAPLEGFSVSIHAPVIEMPLLKRLGEANFVPEPGIQNWLSTAYQAVSRMAIQTAFKDANEEE